MAATPDEHGSGTGLRAHATTPERTVFTEPDNSDGWIATDLTVAVER